MVDTKNYDYYISDLAILDGSNIIRAKNLVWWWKDLLARSANTAPWIVDGSSDSVVGAMDAVDRWGTTFDDTKLIFANNGSPHSWVVLRSPGLIGAQTWYILLAYNISGFWEQLDIIVSNAVFTGGSNTQDPTTAGQSVLFNNLNVRANLGAGTTHGAVADDGTFWMSFARVGSFADLFVFATVDNLRTGDTDGVAFYFADAVDTNPLDDWTTISATGDLFGSANVGTIDPYRYDNGASRLASSMGEDMAENKWVKWPLWLWYNDAALSGQSIKGRIVDVEIAIGASQGDVHDDTGTIIATKVGPVWLPADAAPTLT